MSDTSKIGLCPVGTGGPATAAMVAVVLLSSSDLAGADDARRTLAPPSGAVAR